MIGKRCRACCVYFEDAAVAFYACKSNLDGRHNTCKQCWRERTARNLRERPEVHAAWRERNAAEIRSRKRVYNTRPDVRARNTETQRRRRAGRTPEEQARSNDRHREYRLSHGEQCRAGVRAWLHARTPEQVAAIRARQAEWRKSNVRKLTAWANRWRRQNPAASAAIKARRRALAHRLADHYTKGDVRRQLALQNWLCFWCDTALPQRGYHVDHLIPLARGGLNDAANIVIACARCNRAKHQHLPLEWAPRHWTRVRLTA